MGRPNEKLYARSSHIPINDERRKKRALEPAIKISRNPFSFLLSLSLLLDAMQHNGRESKKKYTKALVAASTSFRQKKEHGRFKIFKRCRRRRRRQARALSKLRGAVSASVGISMMSRFKHRLSRAS